MVIRKLEKKETIENIIERGGDVFSDKDKEKKKWVNFTLRIRQDILNQIDDVLEDRVGISKTGWILEAIQEKIKSSHTQS